MTALSETAMVLAAGFGKRLLPLTETKPKPLFEIGGCTMLDLTIDKLVAAGIKRVVVNCFYLADQIEAQLALRHDVEVVISREAELLDTGGGIKNALPLLGDKPFFTINSDLVWTDEAQPALGRMADAWRASEKMDALLLVMPTQKVRGFGVHGDFMLEADGRLWRKDTKPPRSHVWLGAQIVKPKFYAEEPARIFSSNIVWNRIENDGGLFGVNHNGTCFQAGTPDDLAEANRQLASGEGWAVR